VQDHIITGTATIAAKWVWLIPACIALIAIALSGRSVTGSRSALAAAVAAYVGLNGGIVLYQARVPYSTTYDYGQLGFSDTVGFIRSNTNPEDVIVSMKDIGFAADRRYIENYGGLYGGAQAEEQLRSSLASGKIPYAVFTEGRGQDQLVVKPALKQWVESNTMLIRSFGHYRIYRPQSVFERATALR
jgi:hypothetical protein